MSDATYNLNGSFKPTMKRFADLNGPDFFPTPRWATFALIDNEKFDGDIWEDNIDSNAEALIRVCATQELGLPTDTKVAEISGWCLQGAQPQPLVIDGHDPSNYRLKKMAA
jgi:hypothetical protein